jgi:hypothetical protein
MKITGVTIIRNAVINDYPVVEAISSILPVVDEMIVSIDKGEDNTEEMIRNIPSDKIKIVYSTWDMNLRHGGEVLAVETNKVMQHVSADTDWIFYIQADEAVHEKYHPAILAAANKYKDDKKVEGLLFKYLHFYGTYDYIGDSRKWYNCETRIIRNDKSITAYRDAQGFRRGQTKLNVAAIDAYVYHYGWVKSPQQMKAKQKNVSRYWVEDGEGLTNYMASSDVFDFSEFDSLEKFRGTHPSVMQERIRKQNWKLDLDVSKKKLDLKDRLLYKFEKLTGKRLFAFKNHKIIRK